MNDLRADLDRRAAGFTPDRAAFERVLDRAAFRRARRRVTAGVTAFAISAAAFTGLWAAAHGAAVPLATPTPSIEALLPHDGLELGPQSHVGGWVTLATESGLWVAGGGRLYAVDPSTGQASAVASGRWDYDFVRLADADRVAIWIASGPHLWRFDIASRTLTEELDLSALGYVDAVAQIDSQTWVTASGQAGQQVLARIDPTSGEVLAKYTGIGQGLHQLVEAAGYLFVGSRRDPGSLIRIDPRNGERVTVAPWQGDVIHGGGSQEAFSLAVVGHSIWVNWSGTRIGCVDAVTLHDCGGREIEGTALASDGQFLWLLAPTGSSNPQVYEPDPSQPATVSLFDGTTGEALAGPLPLPDTSPAWISASGGHAWIGFHDSGRVIRIDTCPDLDCGSG